MIIDPRGAKTINANRYYSRGICNGTSRVVTYGHFVRGRGSSVDRRSGLLLVKFVLLRATAKRQRNGENERVRWYVLLITTEHRFRVRYVNPKQLRKRPFIITNETRRKRNHQFRIANVRRWSGSNVFFHFKFVNPPDPAQSLLTSIFIDDTINDICRLARSCTTPPVFPLTRRVLMVGLSMSSVCVR